MASYNTSKKASSCAGPSSSTTVERLVLKNTIDPNDQRQVSVIENVNKPLAPHQINGIDFMWKLYCKREGGIIGDEMGLGKTYQTCTFIVSLFKSGHADRVLIVVPTTLLPTWRDELHSLDMPALLYHGYDKEKHLERFQQESGILLTSYDTLVYNIDSLSMWWTYLILDEGHLIKNVKTQRSRAIKSIHADHRLILTGTPIHNTIDDMWSLLNFCQPQKFSELKSFQESFTKPLELGKNKVADKLQRVHCGIASERLKLALEDNFLRRTSDILGLPPKHEYTVWLQLTPFQRALYENFVKNAKSAISRAPLAAIAILKKVCDDPCILMDQQATAKERDEFGEDKDKGAARLLLSKMNTIIAKYIKKNCTSSCKMMFLKSFVHDLIRRGHYVLIFSQRKQMLNILQEMFNPLCSRIDGDVKYKERENIIKEFQEGSVKILLIMSQVGGVGVTLTKADRVIVVDPAWNPSTDDQSVCRAYRMGQNKNVCVYRLLTAGTVEETIYKNQIYKMTLAKVVIETQNPYSYFTEQELKAMFTVTREGFETSKTQKQLDKEHETSDASVLSHIHSLTQYPPTVGVSYHSALFSKDALEEQSDPKKFLKPKDVPTYRQTTLEKLRNNRVVEKVVQKPPDDTGQPSAKQQQYTDTKQKAVAYFRTPDRGQSLTKKHQQSSSGSSGASCSRQKAVAYSTTPDRGQSSSTKKHHQQRYGSSGSSSVETSTSRQLGAKQGVISSREVSESRFEFPKAKVELLREDDLEQMQWTSKAEIKFCDSNNPNVSIAKIKGIPRQKYIALGLLKNMLKSVSTSSLPEEPPANEKKKVNPRELNPYFRNDGSGYPEEEGDGAKSRDSNLLSTSIVGDGGASWKLKAMKRSQEQAAREGKNLDEVVKERWGSLGKLAVSVASNSAAPSHAHLHAIKNRIRQQNRDQPGDQNETERNDSQKGMHAKMRVPRRDESLSWGKRRGQSMPDKDAGVISSALSSLQKFSNDGSFLHQFKGSQQQKNDDSLSTDGDRRDSKSEEPVSRTDGGDRREGSKSEEPSSRADMKPALSANQLAAKVMQLRMKGKHAEADKLLKEAEVNEGKSKTDTVGSNPQGDGTASRYIMHGLKSREKSREEDADMHVARSIMQNKKFSISGQADDEYDNDEGPKRKKRGKGDNNAAPKPVRFEKRILTQQERCNFCFENPKRPRHLVIAIANFTYMMLPQWQPVVPGHCCILPMQHDLATRSVDDNVWDEIRNFKKCLLMMFAKQEKEVVFLETVMGLAKQSRHCMIECIPLPPEVAKQAPLYFKKAIDEAESEWSQHNAKKLIDTSEKGLRHSIPPDFPYFHVEFGLKKGYVHVIDDESQFKSSFGVNVVRGMLRLPAEDMHRRHQRESLDSQKQAVADFRRDWDSFDWTKQLD